MKINLYLLTVLTGLLLSGACKKMDKTYKDFIVPNGISYPGRATSPVFHSGYLRANISWLKGTDPKVVRAKIYWNNYTDSVEFAIPANKDTISYTIPNLPESFYSFIIKTYDAAGNVSVPVEISGSVYGEDFRKALLNRPLTSSTLNLAGNLTLVFDKMATGTTMFSSEIQYTTTSGAMKTIRVDTGVLTLQIPDYKLESAYQLRTLHLPNRVAYDTLYSEYKSVDAFSMNKTEWKVIATSSENPDANSASVGANMIDGKFTTRWLSNAATGGPVYPHFFIVDFNSVRKLKSISLWRWQLSPADVRGPDEVQYQISMDNVTWTTLGNYPFDRTSDNEQKTLVSGLPQARYLKVVAVRGPQNYVILGEVDITVK